MALERFIRVHLVLAWDSISTGYTPNRCACWKCRGVRGYGEGAHPIGVHVRDALDDERDDRRQVLRLLLEDEAQVTARALRDARLTVAGEREQVTQLRQRSDGHCQTSPP